MMEEDLESLAGEEDALINDGEPIRRRRQLTPEYFQHTAPEKEQEEPFTESAHQRLPAVSRSSVQEGMMDSPSEEIQELGFFKVWLLMSQLLGVICIALVSAWVGQYLGGFAWQSAPNLQFNYHPFFMVLGMIFFYGDAILVYRVFRNQRKRPLKLLHFGLHTFAFIFTVIALKAVFDSHSLAKPPIPHLYSLHSWIGLAAVILFALQYACGFIAFLYPGLAKIWRAKYLPLHVFFGLGIFLMATAAAFIGITEKIFFAYMFKNKFSEYTNGSALGVIGNVLGCCMLLFAFLIVYMVVTPTFRRRPLPEEVQLQLEQHSPTN